MGFLVPFKIQDSHPCSQGHSVQVLSAHQGEGQPGGALGRRPGRAHRHDRVGPLPLHPGPQAPRGEGLHGGLGRDLLPPVRTVSLLEPVSQGQASPSSLTVTGFI